MKLCSLVHFVVVISVCSASAELRARNFQTCFTDALQLNVGDPAVINRIKQIVNAIENYPIYILDPFGGYHIGPLGDVTDLDGSDVLQALVACGSRVYGDDWQSQQLKR